MKTTLSTTLTAVIRREGKYYVAYCPEAGTASQGTTIPSAIANLREATELYLEEFPLAATGAPLITTFAAALNAERCQARN